MQGNLITCPGCGLILPKKNYLPDNNYKTSKECFELFAQLSGYTLTLNYTEFIHQLVVDSYGAQHSGGDTKNITAVFSLIGLCLANEHNYTGRQIQKVHMNIPKQKWPRLEPPKQAGLLTVQNVLGANSELEESIKKWAKSVWESWFEHHNWIRQRTKDNI